MSNSSKVIVLLIAAFVLADGFSSSNPVAIGIGFILLFIVGIKHVMQAERAARERKAAKYKELEDAIIELQGLLLNGLKTCQDDALKARVTTILIDAVSHQGANPAWVNSRRIVSTEAVLRWYEEGIAKAAEAKKMIEDYVAAHPPTGGDSDAFRQ